MNANIYLRPIETDLEITIVESGFFTGRILTSKQLANIVVRELWNEIELFPEKDREKIIDGMIVNDPLALYEKDKSLINVNILVTDEVSFIGYKEGKYYSKYLAEQTAKYLSENRPVYYNIPVKPLKRTFNDRLSDTIPSIYINMGYSSEGNDLDFYLERGNGLLEFVRILAHRPLYNFVAKDVIDVENFGIVEEYE